MLTAAGKDSISPASALSGPILVINCPVITAAAQQRIRASDCDVRFDDLTRHLYATDASIYQIEPAGVAFPTSANEASQVIKIAADENVSITPRGAGTSLVGNAIGEG